MIFSAAALCAIAVLLAGPIPALFARAHWPTQAPATALLLWQAIALSGGISMISAPLLFGLSAFGDTVYLAAGELYAQISSGTAPQKMLPLIFIGSALLIAGYLIVHLFLSIVGTIRHQRTQRTLIALLSRPLPQHPHTRVIDLVQPIAYCLPGNHSVSVLSEGLLSLVNDRQLEAIIAHEKAHLRQRHLAVLVAFDSWNRALPWLPTAKKAHRAVSLLLEMLADDQSKKITDAATLAQAIARIAEASLGTPQKNQSFGATSNQFGVDTLSSRVDRLLHPRTRLTLQKSVLVWMAVILILATPGFLIFVR